MKLIKCGKLCFIYFINYFNRMYEKKGVDNYPFIPLKFKTIYKLIHSIFYDKIV